MNGPILLSLIAFGLTLIAIFLAIIHFIRGKRAEAFRIMSWAIMMGIGGFILVIFN